MRSTFFTTLFLLVGISLSAQTLDKGQLDALTEKQWQSGLSLLNELVSMPNDAVSVSYTHLRAHETLS
jgi:hypothetical protein